MNAEIPERIMSLAKSLAGSLVTNQTQVSGSDILSLVAISRQDDPQKTAILAFTFPDESKRQQFRDAIILSYDDTSLFEPWIVREYLSQPAADYFSCFGPDDGSSGPVQLAISGSNYNPAKG